MPNLALRATPIFALNKKGHPGAIGPGGKTFGTTCCHPAVCCHLARPGPGFSIVDFKLTRSGPGLAAATIRRLQFGFRGGTG